MTLSPERQSAQMSKTKNVGLDQYGAKTFGQQLFGTAGIKGVKSWIEDQNCKEQKDTFCPIYCVAQVFFNGGKTPVFFVASRGHHADIGGVTPGSMPPHSKSIFEEGAVFKSFFLVKNGVFQEEGKPKGLSAVRQRYGCAVWIVLMWLLSTFALLTTLELQITPVLLTIPVSICWFISYCSQRLDYYNKTVKNHHSRPNDQYNNSYIVHVIKW